MLVGPFPCLFDSLTELVVSVSSDFLRRHAAAPLRGFTALHFAARRGHGSTVGLLLQHKAPIVAMTNDGPGA